MEKTSCQHTDKLLFKRAELFFIARLNRKVMVEGCAGTGTMTDEGSLHGPEMLQKNKKPCTLVGRLATFLTHVMHCAKLGVVAPFSPNGFQ